MNIKFGRVYRRLAFDIVPGALHKVGRRPSQPKGRERTLGEEWSMAVPFRYVVPSYPEQIAVVCHIFHTDMTRMILTALADAEIMADLFISTDTSDKANKIQSIAEHWTNGTIDIRVVENRGRDIAPKLITFADVYNLYPLILFLHSKRSEHAEAGNGWRDYLLSCLIGSPGIVRSIQDIFALCPKMGIVMPAHFPQLRQLVAGIHWGQNFRKARRLAWKMDIDIGESGLVDFPSGSMFWARPAALRPLLSLGLKFSDFPPEPVWKDGTLAHCIERLILFSCEKAGLTWLKVVNENVATPEQPQIVVRKPLEVDEFITRHRCDLLHCQTD
jgi:lipopolysaccharide biosynthesis protein